MAAVFIDTIKPSMLEWAYKRAGYTESNAIATFPLLEKWLRKETVPTLTQLQKFCAKFFIPFGYIFLEQAPIEKLPFTMFRSNGSDKFDVNVYDVVLTIQKRQDWLEEYLQDNEIETCQFVGKCNIKTPINNAVNILRKELNIEERWAFSLSNASAAIAYLTQKLEDKGVFISFNGIVKNNTHRPIKVEQCRGFALVNKTAPYIFINSNDSKTAQVFTIIHELTHLLIGHSAGHAGEENVLTDEIEKYCDSVAANFLVPTNLLYEVWQDNIAKTAKIFKVSELVIMRKAYEVGLINRTKYKQLYSDYKSKNFFIKNKPKNGGDFYRTSVKRIGKTFAIHIRNAVQNRQLSYTEAYRLTDLYGNTYQHFMSNNI